MSIKDRKNSIDEAYFHQINAAVDKNVPTEHLKTTLDAFTQLQLELQDREIEMQDIQTLAELVAILEQEVQNYDVRT